jgi:hypothetical protein
LSRRFSADMLWDIANCQIDRIRSLSTKLSELGFVGGYYDGNDGAIFASGCSLNLFLTRKGEDQRTVTKI